MQFIITDENTSRIQIPKKNLRKFYYMNRLLYIFFQFTKVVHQLLVFYFKVTPYLSFRYAKELGFAVSFN